MIKSNPQVQELSVKSDLYGVLEVKDNLLIMREEMPFFLDIRGFSKVKVGTNRIELAKPHGRLANFSDCKELSLSPQIILGVKDTPKVELTRVNTYSGEEWVITGNEGLSR